MAKSNPGMQSSPVTEPPSTKKSSSSVAKEKDIKNQRSILGFFQKKSANDASSPVSNSDASSPLNDRTKTSSTIPIRKPVLKKASRSGPSANLTPVPSSDAPEASDDENENMLIANKEVEDHGLPSPVTPAERGVQQDKGDASPLRKVGISLAI
jgi:DNA mismatch repair protein MSH6